MIKLIFKTPTNAFMNFMIRQKEIFYTDRIWKSWIRCIPKDDKFELIVRNSRNKLPPQLVTMFNLTEQDKAEYEAAKNEFELADIIIRDCKLKALMLIDRKEEPNGNT